MSSILKQHRVKKRRAYIRTLLMRILLLFLLLVSGIAALLFFPLFKFENVSVSGNASVSSEDIMRIAHDVLAKKILFFPASSVFLFRPAVLEQRIQEEIPLIAAITVSRTFRRELAIHVTERAVWSLYCGSSADCFYIAEDGVLAVKAASLTGNALFRILDKRSEVSRALGEQVVAEALMAQIRQAKSFLEARYSVTAREAVLGHVFEDRVEITTDEGWYLIFDTRTNMEHALENLALVLEQQIKDRKMLEYVDIRFEGKVFYKER